MAATDDQMMMPTIAPPTVARSTTAASMMPLPIVLATAVPERTPSRLRTAAITTAW
jgi:hypothetical protein